MGRVKSARPAPNRLAELELLHLMLVTLRERCDQLEFVEVSSLLARAQAQLSARIADTAMTYRPWLN